MVDLNSSASEVERGKILMRVKFENCNAQGREGLCVCVCVIIGVLAS